MSERDTPERLVAAATELFARRGFGRVSLHVIARAAHTSPSSVVHFFGSKEGLLREACERAWEHLGGAIGAVVRRRDPLLVRWRKVVGAVLDYAEAHADELRLALVEFKDLELSHRGPTSAGLFELKKGLDEMLREGKKRGLFASNLCVPAAREAVIGLIEGMLFTSLVADRHGGGEAGYGRDDMERVAMRAIRGFCVEAARRGAPGQLPSG